MQSITQEQSPVKDVHRVFRDNHSAAREFERTDLSPNDRLLLLTSALGLFLRRLKHGIPLLRSDLVRLEVYADVDRVTAEEAAA